MTIYDGIKTYLKAQSLAVADRVYSSKAPDAPTTPYLVFTVMGPDPLHAHEGASLLLQRSFQFSVFSTVPSEALGVSDAVRRLIDGFKGVMGDVQIKAVFWEAGRHLEDYDTQLEHVSNDYFFQWIDQL